MFLFEPARLVDAFLRFYPELAPDFEAASAELASGEAGAAAARLHAAAPAISIDYAIMERDGGLLMLEAPFSWSDVGAPSALPDVWGRDADGNCVTSGVGVTIDATGNVAVLRDPAKVVALLGVHDLGYGTLHTWALVLFGIAAAGGLFLASQHMSQVRLSNGVVAIHALVAVAGFLVLLAAVFLMR